MKKVQNPRMNYVEERIRKYTMEANSKLDDQYSGTREAMFIIAHEKVQEFIGRADLGLDRDERELLKVVISRSMMQSFCLGYGLGKIEGQSVKKVFL